MNEWMDTISRYAAEVADSLEAHADHLRGLGKADKADGVMFAANRMRADAKVFGLLTSTPDLLRLRRGEDQPRLRVVR